MSRPLYDYGLLVGVSALLFRPDYTAVNVFLPLPIYGGGCRPPKLAMAIHTTQLFLPLFPSSLLPSLPFLLFFSQCKTVIDYAVFS